MMIDIQDDNNTDIHENFQSSENTKRPRNPPKCLAIATHNERKYRDFIEAKPKEFANNRVQQDRRMLKKTRNNEPVVPLKIIKKAVLSTNLSQSSVKSPG